MDGNNQAVVGFWHANPFPGTTVEPLLNTTFQEGSTFLYIWLPLAFNVTQLNFTLVALDDGSPAQVAHTPFSIDMVRPEASSGLSRGEITAIALSLVFALFAIPVVVMVLLRRRRRQVAAAEKLPVTAASGGGSPEAAGSLQDMHVPDMALFNVIVKARVAEIEGARMAEAQVQPAVPNAGELQGEALPGDGAVRSAEDSSHGERVEGFAGLPLDGTDDGELAGESSPPYVELGDVLDTEAPAAAPAVEDKDKDILAEFYQEFQVTGENASVETVTRPSLWYS